ncbi:hypothetical protein GCM10009731_30760 [Streptomyces globosus]
MVPPTPKADTPARRTRSPRGYGTGSVRRATPPPDQSALGVGRSTCRVRGSASWRSAWNLAQHGDAPGGARVALGDRGQLDGGELDVGEQ